MLDVTTELAVSLTVVQMNKLVEDAVANALRRTTELNPQAPEWMSVRDASEYSRLAQSTVRQAIRLGRLQSTKVGRRVLITRMALDKFLSGGMTTKLTPRRDNLS